MPTTLTAVLDATASADPNGEQLTYQWRVVRSPGPDSVLIVSPTAAQTQITFVPGLTGGPGSPMVAAGHCLFEFSVSDGMSVSTDTVAVLALDPATLAPKADPGLARTVKVQLSGGSLAPTVPDFQLSPPDNLRDYVRLDGRESADPSGRPLTYLWRVATQPSGSDIALSGATSAFPTFRPLVAGAYEFELIVNNGLYPSAPETVTLLVEASDNRPPTAIAVSQQFGQPELASGPRLPVLVFRVGDQVVLDGSLSTDADATDHGSLTYRWSQQAGQTVSLEPGAAGVRGRRLHRRRWRRRMLGHRWPPRQRPADARRSGRLAPRPKAPSDPARVVTRPESARQLVTHR